MSYELSDDETKILLMTAMEPIYRHSFMAEYYVWNSVTRELLPLSEKGSSNWRLFRLTGSVWLLCARITFLSRI